MSKPQYVHLDPTKHNDIRLIDDSSFSHAKDFKLVNIGFNEIASLSGCMPLVLVKNGNDETLTLACCVGIEELGNVYCGKERWLGHAVPLSIQCYPFNFTIEGNRVNVLIDESSHRLTKLSGEGAKLFSSDGQPTTILKQQQENLATLLAGQEQAAAFVSILKQHDLLSPLSVTITRQSGQSFHTDGLYSINEEKYAQLEADTVLQFHKEGISMAINALLLSLRQYNRLVQLTQSFDDPAMKVGIKLDNSL